jgi:hypothetical protein
LAELEELIKIATEKKLFLMEAVWTRFVSLLKFVKRPLSPAEAHWQAQHPIAYAVQKEIFSGKHGKIKRV